MQSSKGAIELSFNVLFAGLIGVVAFMLAFSFIMAHLRNFENEKRIDFANSLFRILIESYEHDNLAQLFTFNKAYKFKLDCNALFFGRGSVSLKDMVVFGPSTFLSNQIGISIERFEMPFYVANIVLLYPRKSIILYKSDEEGPWLYYLLQNSFVSAKDSNGKDFLDLEISKGSFSPNPDSIIVRLENEEFDFPYDNKSISWDPILFNNYSILVGNLSYNDENYPFLGKEMLMGAILSDNYTLYSCNVRKLLEEYNRTLRVYKKRLELMPWPDSDVKPGCASKNESSLKLFNNLSDAIGEAYDSLSYDSFYTIAVIVKNLMEVADDATRYSCPSIY